MNEIIALLEKGESITAIKLLKERHSYGLIQAKRIVENIIERKYGGMAEWRDSLREKRRKARVA